MSTNAIRLEPIITATIIMPMMILFNILSINDWAVSEICSSELIFACPLATILNISMVQPGIQAIFSKLPSNSTAIL